MVYVLLSAKGRINRQDYWLQGILPLTVLLFLFAALGAWLVPNSMGLGILLAPFPLIYPYFAVSAKRFHDLNLSSWWLIAFLVPFVGLIAPFVLGFWPGGDGANRFDRAVKAG